MNVQVETHSGYKADEYPMRFRTGDAVLDVIEIEDRWYGPGYAYFRIFASDAKRYMLRQSLEDRSWTAQAL
ncbi:MAG: hypothetical protein GF418_11475 [Chitinivibrionales bacterium]|nr:hypothetical protein [Chitinivibrionales bacterium]MBD3396235.1 hypothetical protein [Chitinivibrionales bacterium]